MEADRLFTILMGDANMREKRRTWMFDKNQTYPYSRYVTSSSCFNAPRNSP